MLTNLSFCATQVPLFHAVVSLDPFCHPDISKIRITTKHMGIELRDFMSNQI